MVLYVLSPWNENEHCITGDLNLVNDDDDGRLRSWWGLLLRHRFTVFSPLLPPHRKLRPPATEPVSLADGERNTKGRTDVHPLG